MHLGECASSNPDQANVLSLIMTILYRICCYELVSAGLKVFIGISTSLVAADSYDKLCRLQICAKPSRSRLMIHYSFYLLYIGLTSFLVLTKWLIAHELVTT